MIRKRGAKWQVDLQVNGQRFRKSVLSEEAAIILEKRALERMELGQDPNPPAEELGPVTFQKLCTQVTNRYWVGTKNERTARININAAVSFFGADIHPSEITPYRIDEYIGHLKTAGNAGPTINRKLSALSKVLRYGHERGWLKAIPQMDRMEESTGRTRWYTEDEMARLYAAMEAREQADLADVVRFLEQTGARASEACRLLWEDVDFEGGIIALYETKNKRPRGVPMTAAVYEMLKAREARIHPSARRGSKVFPGYTDSRDTTSPLTDAWRLMAGSAKIEGRLHDLRHTFASRLVQRGASLQAVQELLGHSNIQITMRYAHLAPDNLRATVGLLEGVTTSGQNPTRVSRFG